MVQVGGARMGQELLRIMSRMIEIHDSLIKHSNEKKAALIERKTNELTSINNNEQGLLQELRQLEELRQQLTVSITKIQSPSYTDVFNQLSPAVKRIIEGRRLELKEKAEHLKRLNEENDELIRDGVAFVQHMIGHMTSAPEVTLNYGRPNQRSAPEVPRGYFDTKA